MKSFSLPLQNDVAQPEAPAPAQRRALNRRGPAPLSLEPRVMFDGATADAAVAAAKTVAAEVPTAMAAERSDAFEVYVAPAVQAAAQGRQEIIFVEDNISDLGALLRAVPAGAEIVVLDHTRDGLQQMIAALDGRAPVDAIHLVTHGRAGQIELGTSVLDSAGLDRYAAALGELGGKLSADGDLLFYGCDLAASADGLDLVERIGQLTGADVAASTDRTGSSGYGNWILEARSGAVEAAPMELDRAGWTGELDTSTTYNANWLPLSFNNTTAIIGTGVNNGDVVRFNNVITLNGQVVDAVVTTTISGTTISSYDSLSNPSSNPGYFQPNLNTTVVGGNATFTISFYKGGSYTGAGTGTAVTLQNVVVNSYDIDSLGTGADRQFQSFKGFARYELAKSTFLVPSVQADGTVTFLYTTNNPQNNPSSSFSADAYRVRVYYDSMSTFEVNAGVAGAKAQAYFAFDFSVGPSWTGETTVTGNPAPILSYSTINFVEAAANDGAIVTTSTITLSNGTFTGTNGQSLAGVGFSNLPAGLSAQLIRTSDTTAVLSFTGNATAHANANDISNLGISFGNTAFTSGNAGAVTGASRFDLTIDFADPPADASAPVVATGQVFTYAENRAEGTLLGTVSASDNVGVTGFRFGATGTSTSADGYFSIGSDGKVRLTTAGAAANAASNDYENGANSFTHAVQARDAAGNWSAAVNLVLNVTNIDEQAPVFTSGTTASVVEGQAVLYTASANDNLDFTDKVVSYAIKPGTGDANLLAINPGSGVVSLASGNLDAGAKSSYMFTVVAQDATGNLREQVVTVAVTNSNQAPVAGAASFTIAEDNIHTGALPAASDPDGDPVSYALATGAQHGSVQLAADGSYTYTPAVNYHGGDSFTYTVSDGKGGSNTYTVNISVTPVNDLPVAGNTNITTAEDTARTGSLPVASDADGDTVAYAKASDPAHGTVSIDSDGKYTYTPAANYHGTDSFTYTVSDGSGGSNTYTVNVNVTPVNDLPVAGNTNITTAEDTAKAGSLPVASDADGDTVTYAKASDPAHGAVIIASDGTYTYTPSANYHGTDSFTYTVSDGSGGSNTYTVNVTVRPVNDLPVAGNTIIMTAEDTAKAGSLPVASDADGDTVTYAKASDPAHGAVIIASDGTYTYTPAVNYHGTDSFTYTVSDGNGGSNTYTVNVTVTPVNDLPVAGNTSIMTAEDTAKAGSLPASSDADGDTVTYAKASDPSHGAVIIASDGIYTYTPSPNYHGTDSFTYTVSDGSGGSNTYTVNVNVMPVNDLPVAGSTNITTAEDTAKAGSLPVASDADGDTVTYAKASDPAHGAVIIASDGTYTYTPAVNYHGTDSFTYTVSDGNGGSNTYTVNVNVTPVNDLPVAGNTSIMTAEDTAKAGSLPASSDADGDTVTYAKASDPAHGAVIIASDGTYTYTPAANYHGTDSFTYTVSDGNGGSNTYTVNVDVTPVNDAPVAAPASISTIENQPTSGQLPLASDVDGDTVSYAKATDPAHGTVNIDSQGRYTYTPAAGYSGSDSFSYTVSDGNGGTNTYVVTVAVGAINHAPIGTGATITTVEDTPSVGSLPAASDSDGDTITYAKAGDPSHGTVTVAADGTYTYTPIANYYGTDSFTYTISDGQGGSNTYTVNVNVTPVNDLPVAGNTSIMTAEDTAKAGSLPAASDADGDTVTYAKASDPAHGAVIIASDGTYTYTPIANYHGTDSFTYTVSDGNGGSNTYTANVTVTPANDLPVAGNTNITTAEDTAKAGSLPAASDADGDTVTYAKASDPAHGAVIIANDGTYTYTPSANYHGADSFTYTVSDGHGGSNTYTVNVNVTPVNDLPVAGNTNITTAEDTARAGSLPAASDADGDTVVYAKGSDPAHGAVIIASDGTYTYTPAANYHGADSFTYTVSDGQGGSNTYTVNVDVTPVNDLPVAGNANITTAEDTAKAGTLPAASDVDGDTPTYSKASDPAHGTVSIAADGTYTYTPAANYHGTDSFIYTVSDGNGGSNTYTVNVIVTPVNDAPVAAPATIVTAEDTVIAGSLPAASDVDGDAVSYTKASNPAHGSLVIGADGSYTYTPAANYHGNDSFSYRISDGKGGSNVYTVEVNVTPVNDLPIAAGAIVWTLKNETSSGKLPAASDVDGDTVTYATGRAPQHGTVSIDAGGNYTYTPARGYSGTDSFTFTVNDGQGGSNTYDVTVVVGATNEAPVGAGTSIVTREDSAVAGALPAATDADGDVVTFTKAGEPAHGKLVIQPGGSYLYTPDAGFHGADSFSYTISDGQGGSNTYTVEVTVTALNRAPVAADASIATGEDTPIVGDLPLAQDANGDIPLYSLASGAGHGTVSVAVDGGYTYVPHPDFHGSDSFSYTVSDGKGGSNTYTVAVEVAPRNDLPVGADGTITTSEDTAVSGRLPAASDADGDTLTYAKASDPLHGSVTVRADGGYTYVPHPDYHGADSFRYTISDGQGGSQTYTVTVTVTPANDAPRAAGASIVTREDVPVTGALPAATDADGDPVGYATASGPAHGSVSIGADGKYTYTPDANFHGSDSFSYTVSDGKGGSNTYTVDVTVTPDNQAPVARAAAIATREDTPLGGALPAATDADGDPVRYTLAANAAHGTVSVGPDGSYTYAPHANYHGSDSFSYTVSDGRGGSNTYTVTVEVSPMNDAPVAQGGASGSGLVGRPLVPVSVPAFTDADSATISYSATLSDGSPLPSWMVFDPSTRSVGGTPPAGSAGTYVLTVTGSDGELTAEASIILVVGNPSAPAQALTIASMTRDTGASATDFVTNDGAAGRSVNGSLSAPLGRNEVVQVSFDGGLTWTVASTSGTAWTVIDSGSHDRNWTIQARVFDSTSGLSGPGAQREVVLDTTAPGASAADSQSTGSTTPVLSGSATLLEGEKLRVTVNGATYEVAAPGGAWTLDLATATPVAGSATPLVVGQSYTVTPVITDLAGNGRTGSTGSVDVTPPVKPAEPVITPTEPPVLPPQLGEPAQPVVESPPLVIPPAGPEPRPVSESVAPGSVADGDSLRPGSGSGYRPLELSSTFDRRSAELSDVYTRSEGFRTVVARADDPALVLFQGVPDQFVETGTQLSLTVPADAFAHTQPKAVVRLSATLQDGRPLPTWIHFNGQTGQFTGEVPKGLKGELRIKLIARDMEGREAAALFRINVGSSVVAPDGKAAPLGKPGLSQQLRAAPPRAVPGRG